MGQPLHNHKICNVEDAGSKRGWESIFIPWSIGIRIVSHHQAYFGLLYRETVDIFPGTWVLVSTGLLTIALGLIVFVHVGTKETNSEVNEEVMNKIEP